MSDSRTFLRHTLATLAYRGWAGGRRSNTAGEGVGLSVTTGSVVAIAAVAFVALWLVITFVLSFAAGWNGLAARYRSELPFTGRTWSMRSGRMGVVRYNGVLTVGVNPAGM